MTTYNQIASTIIKEQESLMGSVAWYEAGKVVGLEILNESAGDVAIAENQDKRTVIDNLVGQYENLFGLAARKVCKEAVIALIADLPDAEIPSSLQ